MEKITKQVLKRAAANLLFDMTEIQYDVLENEFETLISQMELIGKISGIDDAQPMTFPFEVMTSALRPDIPEKPTPVSDIIKNAAHTEDNQIKVPKVVG